MWPQALQLTRDECRGLLRRLELDSYSHVVSAFRAQGSLTDNKAKILEELRSIFHISLDRHRTEARRVANDEHLSTIADNISGPNTWQEWAREGKRAFPMLPRVTPQTALCIIANDIANSTAKENAKLPFPSATAAVVIAENERLQHEINNHHTQKSKFNVVINDPFKIPEIPATHKKNLKRNVTESGSGSGIHNKRAMNYNDATIPLQQQQSQLPYQHTIETQHQNSSSHIDNLNYKMTTHNSRKLKQHMNLQRYFHSQQQRTAASTAKKLQQNNATIKRQHNPNKKQQKLKQKLQQKQKQQQIQNIQYTVNDNNNELILQQQQQLNQHQQQQQQQKYDFSKMQQQLISNLTNKSLSRLTPQPQQHQPNQISSLSSMNNGNNNNINNDTIITKLDRHVLSTTPVQKYIVEERCIPLITPISSSSSSSSFLSSTPVTTTMQTTSPLISSNTTPTTISTHILTLPQTTKLRTTTSTTATTTSSLIQPLNAIKFTTAATTITTLSLTTTLTTTTTIATSSTTNNAAISQQQQRNNLNILSEQAMVLQQQQQQQQEQQNQSSSYNIITSNPVTTTTPTIIENKNNSSNINNNNLILPTHTPPAIMNLHGTTNNLPMSPTTSSLINDNITTLTSNSNTFVLPTQGKVLTTKLVPIVLSNALNNVVNSTKTINKLDINNGNTKNNNNNPDFGAIQRKIIEHVTSTANSNASYVTTPFFRKPNILRKTTNPGQSTTVTSVANVTFTNKLSNVNTSNVISTTKNVPQIISNIKLTSANVGVLPIKRVLTVPVSRNPSPITTTTTTSSNIRNIKLTNPSTTNIILQSIGSNADGSNKISAIRTSTANTTNLRVPLQKVQYLPPPAVTFQMQNQKNINVPATFMLKTSKSGTTVFKNIKSFTSGSVTTKSKPNIVVLSGSGSSIITTPSTSNINSQFKLLNKKDNIPIASSTTTSNQLLTNTTALDILNMPIMLDNNTELKPSEKSPSQISSNVILGATDWEMELDQVAAAASRSTRLSRRSLSVTYNTANDFSKFTLPKQISRPQHTLIDTNYNNNSSNVRKFNVNPTTITDVNTNAPIIIEENIDNVIVLENESFNTKTTSIAEKSLEEYVTINKNGIISIDSNNDIVTTTPQAPITETFSTTETQNINKDYITTTTTVSTPSPTSNMKININECETDAGFDETIVTETDEQQPTKVFYTEELPTEKIEILMDSDTEKQTYTSNFSQNELINTNFSDKSTNNDENNEVAIVNNDLSTMDMDVYISEEEPSEFSTKSIILGNATNVTD